MRFDTVIIGCGEAGIYAAYELSHKCPDMKIAVYDMGNDIYHRRPYLKTMQEELFRIQIVYCFSIVYPP
jgi:cation diffusion facilitator CzcD-associated flavoprotein CzcO